ncbi:toll/interleukin-1 receptor domain-containing protein [Butyrivibrio sp. VCB2006]|uniref:toll/interleukin-1 receptor domain-containing protein n=1 Tax=Butyrivibrio sp. VCB2006 TaxID=1280679 RepID=UPI000408C33A|nr:toll/interleukin-1 receptor domain-containing protein [Butyrivibrio sp. VCB2006]
MAIHYNAFISYKHAELDNKVAAAIEWDLEHYHIPKKIQKKTGYKKIERIFRDKDELPITSDLSGTIEEALFNSDYLIVLCSTNTHLSTWVEREIKLFLQNHPQENVLTVLVDGEPHDVIPEMLQNREVVRQNDKGESVTVFEPVEPLSCDYRLSRREAKSVELPRLAATLIGCSYNELMNRQRQYKMKRLTAIFSGAMALAVGFGAYMFYSNARINENYRQSLINQSKFLSNESDRLLDNEQRIDALHLALAALPSEKEPDRPVIPEAVSAVSKASLAYVAKTSSNITAVWDYTMPDTIENYIVDYDGSTLAARDRLHNVKVWDVDTHEEVFSYANPEDDIDNIAYIDKDTLLMLSSFTLRAVDVYDGSVKWEYERFESTSISGEPQVMDDGSVLVSTSSKGLYKLDVNDGSIIKKYTTKAGDEYSESGSFYGFELSDDQKKVILGAATEGYHDTIIRVIDLETGVESEVDLVAQGYMEEDDDIRTFRILEDGSVMLAIDVDDGYGNYGFLNMNVLSTSHKSIYCFNEDLTLRWQQDFAMNAISYDSKFVDIIAEKAVGFFSGNKFNVWDLATGELRNEYNVNDSIIAATQKKDRGYPTLYTNMGGMATPDNSEGSDSISVMDYFADNIEKVKVWQGVYTWARTSHKIVFYATSVYDENFTKFSDSPEIKSIVASYGNLSGDYLTYMDDDDENTYIDLFDASEKKYVGRIQLGEGTKYYYDLIAIDNGKIYVTCDKDRTLKLLIADIDSLEVEERVLQEDFSSSSGIVPDYKDGKLIYFNYGDYVHKSVVIYDIEKGHDLKQWGIEQEYGSGSPQTIYCPEKEIIYQTGKYDQIVNATTGEVTEVLHSANYQGTTKVVLDAENDKILTTDNQEVVVYNMAAEELYSISTPNVDVFGMTIYTPDTKDAVKELLVVYSDGYLYRYNAETGEYIGQCELTYSSVYKNAEFSFDMEKRHLFVNMGAILNIVDIDDWFEITYLTTCFGYHDATDSFICFSRDKESTDSFIGYFNQYTVDELIQRAKDMLKGSEMSEDLKNYYGIG